MCSTCEGAVKSESEITCMEKIYNVTILLIEIFFYYIHILFYQKINNNVCLLLDLPPQI